MFSILFVGHLCVEMLKSIACHVCVRILIAYLCKRACVDISVSSCICRYLVVDYSASTLCIEGRDVCVVFACLDSLVHAVKRNAYLVFGIGIPEGETVYVMTMEPSVQVSLLRKILPCGTCAKMSHSHLPLEDITQSSAS